MKDECLIKVFIGSSRSEWLPAKVLEQSIRSRSQHPIEVLRLYETKIQIPSPKKKNCTPRTPFSFQRFLIPELCNYQGKAIYLDADMLLFSDIAELWNISMDGSDVLSVAPADNTQTPQFSVMLLDTEKLLWNINDIVNDLDNEKFTYNQLMYEFSVAKKVKPKIPSAWNSLENFSEDTKLLHYTDMPQQPWVSSYNPLKYLWLKELKEAILSGNITLADIDSEIQLGHVRPSLKKEIDSLLNNSAIIEPIELTRIDVEFNPPYKKLRTSLTNKIKRKLKVLFTKIDLQNRRHH